MSNNAAVMTPAIVGITAFTAFLPSVVELRQHDFGSNTQYEDAIRGGEIAATMFVLGIGALTASMTNSKEPLWIALATVVGLVLTYEYFLRRV